MLGSGSSSSANAALLASVRAHPLSAAYALQWVAGAVQSERHASHLFFAHMLEQLTGVVAAVVETHPLLLGESLEVWKVTATLLSLFPCSTVGTCVDNQILH